MCIKNRWSLIRSLIFNYTYNNKQYLFMMNIDSITSAHIFIKWVAVNIYEIM